MNAETFFENYAVLENHWKEFIQQEIPNRTSSALGMTALRICYYVIKHPNCALKEIALSLDISLGSASQMVQAMTVGGLLQCTPNQEDRRRISIKSQPVLVNFFKSLA